MRNEYKEKIASKIVARYADLEVRIIQDIVRRIKRRAVMTGLTWLSGKIAEYNAEKLGTEYFEVEWHAGARPTHTIWQGRVWSQQQLYDVCGLGTVTGLCGANCYHTYFPFCSRCIGTNLYG